MKAILNSRQLHLLSSTWEAWVRDAPRESRMRSRERVLLVFYLIRFGGLRLAEALNFNDLTDMDAPTGTIRVQGKSQREVQIPEKAMAAIQQLVNSPRLLRLRGIIARLDQGYVRKRFYELAELCNLPPHMAGPQVLRQSRAAELMQANVPLKIVQKFMGQSSPIQAGRCMSFSDEDARRIVHSHLRQEALRHSSARNAFTGTVTRVDMGPVTVLVELVTLHGAHVWSVVTIESVQRLGIRKDQVLTASIKATFVEIERLEEGSVGQDGEPVARPGENVFTGTVAAINRGEMESMVVIDVPGGTLCSILPSEDLDDLRIDVREKVRVTFSSFAVVLGLPEDLGSGGEGANTSSALKSLQNFADL